MVVGEKAKCLLYKHPQRSSPILIHYSLLTIHHNPHFGARV